MKYPAHLIESFIAFATHEGVTPAAKSLGISQPALSRQLEQFEQLIGSQLFQKQGRTKILSASGRELFLQLQLKWTDYDSYIDGVVSQFSKAPPKALSIYGPEEILVKVARNLKFSHPVIFSPVRSSEVITKMNADHLSLGITRLVPDSLDLSARKLFHEGFCLIYPSQWKLPVKSLNQSSLRQLEKLPAVAYGTDSQFPQEFLKKYPRLQGPRLHRVLPNWDALQDLVEKGEGWCIAPANLLRRSPKIQIMPISNELYPFVTYYLTYKKGSTKIPWMNDLIQAILNQTS